MVQAHSGLQIVELYINSFSESIPDIGEGNSDDEQGILGSSEMIHIGMRWMNQICSLRVMPSPHHLRGGAGETIEMLETSVRRVGKIVMVVRVKRVARMKSVKTVVGQQSTVPTLDLTMMIMIMIMM
jgi:hypothetical protein